MNAAEPSAGHLGTVQLQIPSKPEWVAVARLAVAAVANRLPFGVDEIEDLKLALAEACTVVIQHNPESKKIEITCDASASQLRLEVRDDSYRVHADAARGKRAPMTVADTDGLGVFLIQALMDHVEVDVAPHLGSEVVMIKRIGA